MKNLILLISLITLFSCSNEETCEQYPTLTTDEANNLSDISANITGKIITPTCDETVTSQGFVYGEENLPTVEDIKIVKSGSSISASLINLKQNTTYYIRTYFENPIGIYYGNEVIFNTAVGAALVQTNNIFNITATTALISGRVSSNGGGTIISKGFCFSTELNPTVDDQKVDGVDEGSQFKGTLENLTPNTLYYIKAYVENESGVYYGEEKTFETLSGIIQIETLSISNITALSVECGGRVLSDGGADVIEYGLEYSEDYEFNEFEEVRFEGFQENFSSKVENLKNDTSYFIRAYAKNIVGRFYGEKVEFKTKSGVANLQLDKIFNITTISAVTKVRIVDDGGIEKESFGVCWSENNSPTVDDSLIYSNDSDIYTYIKNMSPNKKYYIRAFLKNEVGTSYSEAYEIETLSSISIGDTLEDGVIVHIVPPSSEFYNDGMVNGLIAKTSFRENKLCGEGEGTVNTSKNYGTGLMNTIEMYRKGMGASSISALLYVGAINLCNGQYFTNLSDCGAPDLWYYRNDDKTYDWFIPSLDELMKLYDNYDLIQHHQNGSPAYLNGIGATLHQTSTMDTTQSSSRRKFYTIRINTGSVSSSGAYEKNRLIISKYF